ncbi:MAG: hypothetical protein HYR75_00230, partial [Gemmatimonadetes bacterium]|nr:hypothetical protein [Gemmatimonadota bacterium]
MDSRDANLTFGATTRRALLLLAFWALPALAQPRLASITGRVLTDSAELPIRGAEVVIP